MKIPLRLTILAILLACAGGLHAASTIQFTATACTVAEDAGAVTLTVQRLDDTNTVVSVDYASTNGTAAAGQDYTDTKGTLAFAAGEKVKLFTVPILNDGLKEPNKTFRLALINPTGGGVLGGLKTATVTIVDNDPGIRFRMKTVFAHEDQGGALMTVLRGNDQLLGPFQVEYTITDLTASADDHGTTNGILEFVRRPNEPTPLDPDCA